jgi:hypothetical protein
VIGLIADATGRTDEAVAVAALISAVLSTLHLLNFPEDWDIHILGEFLTCSLSARLAPSTLRWAALQPPTMRSPS